MKEVINIVWFKRDLRIHDHAPLIEACSRSKVLPLFIIEPNYWQLPDHSNRQWLFIRASLIELHQNLSKLGQGLIVKTGNVIDIFQGLTQDFTIDGLYSHQETGNVWTFDRDKQVKKWCNVNQVTWHEHQPYGVIRRLSDRNGWAAQWETFMRQNRIPTPKFLTPLETRITSESLPHKLASTFNESEPVVQAGGRKQGIHLLKSFTRQRGKHYSRAMSSPTTAFEQCSRLSPHLSFGTLSIREATQFSRKQAKIHDHSIWKRSLSSFDKRLHWHCHFIQKLESAPRFEYENMVTAFDGMREPYFDVDKFEAWKLGQTGYPLIDACMRCLRTTGWLNFRMRAMLISFASYQLWLHWREPALHLAQCFTDYEPGIHFCQVQMQSGTTGINTLRIYNPVKQSRDQDPNGLFIRQWLPELEHVHTDFIHEPWNMSLSMQMRSACLLGTDYPMPIVEHIQAAREAKHHMTQWRLQHPEIKEQAKVINHLHGSRRKNFQQRHSKRRPKSESIMQQQKLL